MPKPTAVWCAPGRVNLIGEHTDYTGGYALPFAIEASCTATVTADADSGELRVTSQQRPDQCVLELAALEPRSAGWAGYAAGVVWAIQRCGITVPGLRIALDSTVPTGSGLSSSAALICSVATAVNDLLELGLERADLLALTRSAENDFVGAPTGGLDQLASLYATEGRALFCDMRSLETEQVPLPLADAGLAVLVVDTRAEHRHADGEYGQRRDGCERAAEVLGVESLRDITIDGLDEALARLADDELRRYTRHVVTENERVLRTVAHLHRGEISAVGELLNASHASLRDDFRVTIPELDTAADELLAAGALGARMTGGGFGGSVIALIGQDDAARAAQAVIARFAEQDFREPATMTVQPSRGAHPV